MEQATLPDEIGAVMQNGMPATIVTATGSGIPNATILSQVYYVDASHVALSFQFFNKTTRNIMENPHACVALTDPYGRNVWILDIQFARSETEGPTFDEMDMQIEAIASMTGMSGIFKLQAAHIYRIKSFEKIAYPSSLSA